MSYSGFLVPHRKGATLACATTKMFFWFRPAAGGGLPGGLGAAAGKGSGGGKSRPASLLHEKY